MSIDQTDVVDAIGIENRTGDIVLTIFDHLPWNGNEHFLLLQEKMNAYLRFIESGEIFETYPNTKDRKFVINVVCKYNPDQSALSFLKRIKTFIDGAGFSFKYEHFSG